MQRTYYEILGVWPDATIEQIKSAYRRQMRRHHPDVSFGSEVWAASLNEAYRQLCNEDRRRAYDLQLAPAEEPETVSEPASAPAVPVSRPPKAEPRITYRRVWDPEVYRGWRFMLIASWCFLAFSTGLAVWALCSVPASSPRSALAAFSPMFLCLAWIIAILERSHWYLWAALIGVGMIGVASVPAWSPLHFLAPAVPPDLLTGVLAAIFSVWFIRLFGAQFTAMRAVRPPT